MLRFSEFRNIGNGMLQLRVALLNIHQSLMHSHKVTPAKVLDRMGIGVGTPSRVLDLLDAGQYNPTCLSDNVIN